MRGNTHKYIWFSNETFLNFGRVLNTPLKKSRPGESICDWKKLISYLLYH